jgi:hypothetical protein
MVHWYDVCGMPAQFFWGRQMSRNYSSIMLLIILSMDARIIRGIQSVLLVGVVEVRLLL